MESFNVTCALSGLPIRPGDPVKILFLSQCPSPTTGVAIAPNGTWFPRAAALDGIYCDYGDARDVGPESLKQVVQRQFDRDIPKRGWGQNKVRDVPTHRGMSWDALMTAMSNHRVRAKPLRRRGQLHQPVSRHVPTLARVAKLLRRKGYSTERRTDDFQLSLPARGVVVVTVGTGNEERKLAAAREILSTKYACSIRNGRMNKELMLTSYILFSESQQFKKDQSVPVRSVLIRAEVWDWICAHGGVDYGVQFFRRKIDELDKLLWDKNTESCYDLRNDWFSVGHPFREGLYESMCDAIQTGSVDMTAFAETFTIVRWMVLMRKNWELGSYAGQENDLQIHRDFHQKLARIADALLTEAKIRCQS